MKNSLSLLRQHSVEELVIKLDSLNSDLCSSFIELSNNAKNTNLISNIKKERARVMTIINEKKLSVLSKKQ